MYRRITLAVALSVGAAGFAASSASAQTLTTTLAASGLTFPIYVTHAPGDYSRIFIIEKQGRIRIVRDGTLLPTAFLDIDAIITGGTVIDSERGLLGLAFHPNFASNGRFFVNYTAVAGSGDTVVAEYTVSGNPMTNDVANTTGNVILTFDQPQANHNGGWIDFGPDGYLYIATGDGGNADDVGTGHTEPGGNGQDITSKLLGKILRIDVDGDDFPADANRDYRIPPTNPFVGVTGDDEIWDYGLRNPWRPSFDRGTGDMYIADVGQADIEEVNYRPAGAPGGRNWGWRCYEGNNLFNFDSVCQAVTTFHFPIHTYTHSLGCSITGGYVYRGCAIPALQGTYFFADYCQARIWSFRVVGGAVTQFTTRTTELDPPGALAISTITSFGEDAYGELYICDQSGGEVFKIVPTVVQSPDCNGNGRNDACEILDGSALDDDNDGRPNECECVGDLDNNNRTDLTDLARLLSSFGLCAGNPAYLAAADLNGDDCVSLTDLAILLSAFGCM